MKILSPAGNLQCLKLAIINGADEVYLGINDFNARNNIDGFNLQTLKEGVDFAHLFGVKVLLAINILFSNQNLQSALNTLIEAYNLGVDAFIVQDLGLAYLVHKHYPQIELHASTQMGLHNLEGVKFAQSLGFKRVVLARETPLEEIKRIKQNTNVEIEYFAQGALCVSFSGNCYLSAYMHNASGNLGKCKQLCRLPYTMLKSGKPVAKGYLLSAKDFSLIDKLDELSNAGVDVIKIEGRARRPYYVATATKEYYNALHNKNVNKSNLELAFNRGYTQGYFNGNGSIISNYSGHIGINVAKITKVKWGKKFNEIYITSNKKLYPKSSFKVFKDGIEISVVTPFDLREISHRQYVFTTTQKLEPNCNLHLIVDANAEEEVLKQTIKKKIDVSIIANQNQQIKAEVKIDDYKFTILGDICALANTQPLKDVDITNCLNKSDLFTPNINILTINNVFLTKAQLNKFRRDIYEQAFKCVTAAYERSEKSFVVNTDYAVKKFTNFEFVESYKTLPTAKNIIYSPTEYMVEDVQKFVNKCKKENKVAYLDLPNFALSKDIILLQNIITKTGVKFVANNYYALGLTGDKIIGGGLNVYNNISASVFNLPVITAESDISTKAPFPYMTLRHCPFKNHLNANCNNCPYTNEYSYKMENGKTLKLKRKKLSTCTFYLTE